jgi:hypothetical protein
MINFLNIFLAQYFQGKKCDVLVRIPPFQHASLNFDSFPKFSFFSIDEMDEIKTLRQLLQASCPKDQLSTKDIAIAPTKLPI